MSETSDDIFVVIAAFNERKSIANVVRGLLPAFPTIVVVDDGSRDETAALARNAGATVLIHPVNLGQGAALQTGISYAVRQGAAFIVTFDADGQHSPADVWPMIEALRKSAADVALGSRFLGQAIGIDKKKAFVLKAATIFTALTTGLRLTDCHNGLRVFTRKAAESISIRQNVIAHEVGWAWARSQALGWI
jgi:glycosyltransferase involved in cell wall biosynthesis